MDVFGKMDEAFDLMALKKAPFPEGIVSLGTEGLKEIWHEAKLRKWAAYSMADLIVRFVAKSIDLKIRIGGSNYVVICFVEQILYHTKKLDEIEKSLHRK